MKEKNIRVIKDDKLNTVPLFCPLCEIMMSRFSDIEFYNSWQACSSCSTKWAEPNRELWKSGWRPDLKEITKKS